MIHVLSVNYTVMHERELGDLVSILLIKIFADGRYPPDTCIVLLFFYNFKQGKIE